uniref:Glutaredoxin domain-containing protein n=1 Tax=Haemonchus contortus TaxID=6289 RepID=A0A7I4XYT0_HAECO
MTSSVIFEPVMLILLILTNPLLILGSTTVGRDSMNVERQKSFEGSFDDYADYGIDRRQSPSESSRTPYSLPIEEQSAETEVWPAHAQNGRRAGVYGQPLTTEFIPEQGIFLVEEPRNNHRRFGPPAERSRVPEPQTSRPDVKYPVFHNGRPAHSMGYSYAGYIQRQAKRYPIMMYTLVQCVPCQRAKHLLAVNYADAAAYFLELVGHEDWQRQLQVDLHRMTGQITFPYIFICGRHIGGSMSPNSMGARKKYIIELRNIEKESKPLSLSSSSLDKA